MKNKILLFISCVILATIACNNTQKEAVKNIDTAAVTVKTLIKEQTDTTEGKSIPVKQSSTLRDFYKSVEKQSQVFKISNSKDISLTCSEGTIIKIKSGCFVYENDGKKVESNITIEVKEFNKLSDIILANLSTTSNNELLETGGMVYINATANNKQLKLKDNADINVLFPKGSNKNDMNIFLGNQKTNQSMNWKLAPKSDDINKRRIIAKPDVVSFGGDNTISKNIQYPAQAVEKKVEGTVVVGCIVTETGKIEEPRIIQGIGFGCDEEAIRLVKLLPNIASAKYQGRPVIAFATIPVKFFLSGRNSGDEMRFADYTKKLEEKYSDYKDKIITDINKDELNYYVFNTHQLGWINCDKFYEASPKTTFQVNLKPTQNSDMKIVFKNIKSIMAGISSEASYSFPNVPIGEDVIIIAIKYDSNQPLIAIKETKITKEGISNLDYTAVTLTSLKQKLEKLNNL